MQPFETVNGVKAQGGSIDAAGPVIAGGMVLTNSGYGQWRGKPGNVLLAFGLPVEDAKVDTQFTEQLPVQKAPAALRTIRRRRL